MTVLPPDSAVLSSSDETVTVDVSKGYALFKNPTSLSKAETVFASYLSVRFVYTDGSLTFEINSATYDMLMDRNVGIELVNENGIVINKYRVFVFGDGNNDGAVNSADSEVWANAIFRQTSGSEIYLDANGDGTYNLTDFSILMSRYGGQNG